MKIVSYQMTNNAGEKVQCLALSIDEMQEKISVLKSCIQEEAEEIRKREPWSVEGAVLFALRNLLVQVSRNSYQNTFKTEEERCFSLGIVAYSGLWEILKKKFEELAKELSTEKATWRFVLRNQSYIWTEISVDAYLKFKKEEPPLRDASESIPLPGVPGEDTPQAREEVPSEPRILEESEPNTLLGQGGEVPSGHPLA